MRYEKCIGRCSTKILYVYADNIVLASGSVRVESSNGFKEKNEKKMKLIRFPYVDIYFSWMH